MELMEAIKGRRSVRKFKPDPIPKEDLEEIIQAGLCAPSAQNLQPWYFVALTKKEDLSYLFSELGTTAFSHRKELEARFKNNPEVVEETMEFMSAMGGSQTIILGFLNKPDYSDELLPSCIESVAAAMENMCLAAYDKGMLGRSSGARRQRFGQPLCNRSWQADWRYCSGIRRHGAEAHQAEGCSLRNSLSEASKAASFYGSRAMSQMPYSRF